MSKQSLPPAIFLMGPTAAGKTAAAIDLVRQAPCDIVSVDSGMIYRGMDIGTAKPDAGTLSQAPHRLIDIRDPSERYSAADFRRDALLEMEAITAVGRIPLLVGGTMLYFKVLSEGIAPLPAADEGLRSEIERQAEEFGWAVLHQELAEVDPVAAEKIHPNNPQRLMRALEVYRLTGIPLGEHWRRQQQNAVGDKMAYNVLKIAVAPKDRAVLHARIETRFQQMLAEGFIDEVKALYARDDLSLELPAVRTVGYRQIWRYLDGQMGYDEMVSKALAATRQLAKRQLTWLRGWSGLQWIEPESNISQKLLKHLRAAQY